MIIPKLYNITSQPTDYGSIMKQNYKQICSANRLGKITFSLSAVNKNSVVLFIEIDEC